MKIRLSVLIAMAILATTAVRAEPPAIEEIWAIVQQQQAEIEQLKQQLANADAKIADTDEKLEATGSYLDTVAVSDAAPRTRIGGYGELHYNNLDATDSSNDVKEIDFHRFVLFFGHDLTDRISFFSELELEHSISADGEPGEVELEQAYLDFALTDSLSAKAGVFLLPIGIINETHEPPTFYGVERNDVENIIIPSTWWEAGAAFTGHYGNGFSWDLAAHSGLAIPTTGGSAFRVRSGRQKVAEALANDAAYTLRLRYSGIAGLDLAASYQYQADPSQVPGDGLDSGKLLAVNVDYDIGAFTMKGVYARWDFAGAAVEAAGADTQTGWYLEPSYRFSTRLGDWGFYGRYEDVDGARTQDQFSQSEVGLNYWPADGVVLKFDYRQRDHNLVGEAGRDFDGFDVGLGYQF
ncbi:MAG TPA: hypothetical protein PKK10_12415 [Woeseiaceae bacterium]|nr:hypothetical protein [Woeseiaceae bacterium]